jgi:hypothetical protein
VIASSTMQNSVRFTLAPLNKTMRMYFDGQYGWSRCANTAFLPVLPV